ncbi:Rubredoxin-type Fe(Cys)4 protein [Oscillochloris trichoides DG-6]|uniref:Rubredoxin-type Fe(Cys)4 protein n=1 Tax=Oscillochloris trichoides DG-6 TaxID=765420 RepID=E1ICV8_9CHLR|nr:DinB family protein [Oscillochloris trichoides]EFO80989.1 Rubredoxin-type Fe(Cys)4 protein [Oscillochloris trichoides DG-6]
MTSDQDENRRLLCSMSLGYTAYHVWAIQARRERRYNIARFFEASSMVKRIRAERAFEALGEVGTTTENIRRALEGLEPETVATGPVTGTTPLSRDLMTRATRALAEQRDLTAEEIGDLGVCSNCGEMIEGDLPDVCAICGTVREGFIRFSAAESMGVFGPSTIMRRLEQTPATLRAIVEGLSDAQLAHRAVSHSLKELIGHLTDMDVVFRERAWLILETKNPRLPSAHPPSLARAKPYNQHRITDLLEAYQTSRQQTLNLLRGLTPAAWHRTGYHEIFGTIPLTHQGNWVIEHERGHLIEMAQIRHELLAHQSDPNPLKLPQSVIPEVLRGE